MASAAREDELCIFMSPADLAIQQDRRLPEAFATPQVTSARREDLTSKGDLLDDIRRTCATPVPEAGKYQPPTHVSELHDIQSWVCSSVKPSMNAPLSLSTAQMNRSGPAEQTKSPHQLSAQVPFLHSLMRFTKDSLMFRVSLPLIPRACVRQL